jgi:hypothetical protein
VRAWVALLALVPSTVGAASVEKARLELVRSFLSTMRATAAPTIADFNQFFGPHGEEELLLQLRYEGMTDPLHVMAGQDTVDRVNKRLLAPAKNRSLYLCFLRRALPFPPTSAESQGQTAVIRFDGPNRVRVDSSAGRLLFTFDDDDVYFNTAGEAGKQPLAAEAFLPACKPGSCCE